jgi:hypothetical protein
MKAGSGHSRRLRLVRHPGAGGASRAICKSGRAIENVVDLLARRPRACRLPVAKNMLIDCGGAGLRGGAALQRAKPARRDPKQPSVRLFVNGG